MRDVQSRTCQQCTLEDWRMCPVRVRQKGASLLTCLLFGTAAPSDGKHDHDASPPPRILLYSLQIQNLQIQEGPIAAVK